MIRTTVPPCLQEAFDLLPLVTSVTGGPGPVIPGGSGVVPAAFRTGRFQRVAPLSERVPAASSPSKLIFKRYYITRLSPCQQANRRKNRGFVPLSREYGKKDRKKAKNA